jgi:hypothetical protein
MIQAKELRIGNWVRTVFPINKKPFQVYPMAFKQMPTDMNHNIILDTWEAIPLTEEWAVEFGYECLVDMACSFASESKYRIEITSEDLKKMNVHEAQNLYFALTGKEL